MRTPLHRYILVVVALLLPLSVLFANNTTKVVPPVKIPIYLAGNFGEFRSGHFHSGIDIKTQGRTGIPIHSIAEGYISRIGVSPVGYGNVLYVTHPNRTTSVYGHLERFAPAIQALVKERQYKNESFAQTIYLDEGEIPIIIDEVIGYSGNSGSSGGPHLHFEIRDTESEEPLNPLATYRKLVVDRTRPVIREIALYPQSLPFGLPSPTLHYATVGSNGVYHLADTLEAWGNVGIGIRATDYMDGVRNTFGIYQATLVVESDTLFAATFDRFSFDDSKCINSVIDYANLVERRYYLMKSYREPNNPLQNIYTHLNRGGLLSINSERTYSCRYTVSDLHGNEATVHFYIRGAKQANNNTQLCGTPLSYYLPHYLQQAGMRLYLPSGALPTTVCFDHEATPSNDYYSPIHRLAQRPVYLLQKGILKLDIEPDTLVDKRNYYLAHIVNGKTKPIQGNYIDGVFSAYISELGSYAIAADTTAPTITPRSPSSWIKQGVVRLHIDDKESGIASYRGEVNGAYALFELDAKKGLLTYQIDNPRLGNAGVQRIEVEVTDKCGNTATYRWKK